MKNKNNKIQNVIMKIIIAIFVCLPGFLMSQNTFVNYPFDSTKTYKIELKDGSEFVGSYLEKNEVTVTIKTNTLPKIDIPLKGISKITEINKSDFREGLYWFTNPMPTRYVFGPSAFNLNSGEGYYQNTYIFLNSLNVGVTDNISIGGGLEFLSTFAGGNPIFYLTPKFTIKIAEKLRIGSGLIYISIPGFDNERFTSGVVYGIATYGTADDNLTFGTGWGFFEGEFNNKPVIAFSGMTRIARKTALVTENFLIPNLESGYYGMFSYGIRFFGEKIAVDLTLINSSDISEFIAIGIPCVNFVVKF